MKLHIVMPVINCLELTKAAIDSLNTRCHLHLIDNASDDGTEAWGNSMNYQTLMGVKLDYIRNNEKKGVAESWNQGVRKAFEDPECKYVAILNNDVVLHRQVLTNLMKYMDKTGYLLVTADNVQNKFDKDPKENIKRMSELEYEEPYTDFDLVPIEGWQAEGPDFSCFMINRDTIETIGWFDEGFLGAYCEDQDYHVRIERARRWGETYGEPEPVRCHAKRLSTAPYHHYASQTILRNTNLRAVISNNHAHNQNYYLQKWGADHPEAMGGAGNMTPFGDATKNWKFTQQT